MTWRQKWIRKFSDFFLEIFGSILTSSVVLAHLRPVFGSLGKYWNNLKLLENGQTLCLFGALFVSFWKIIYCNSKFFTVTRYRAKKMLSSYNYPHSDLPLAVLMTKLHQIIVKRCRSSRAVSASDHEPKLRSFVSNAKAVSTVWPFSSTTNRLPKLILASSSIFYDVTNLKIILIFLW